MNRRTARKHIFAILFQIDFHKEFDLQEAMDIYLREEVNDPDVEFIRSECSGTYENLSQIDKLIGEHLSGWDQDRIAKADLTIIRIAIYEMLYTDLPPKISINEAVELAKEFGTDTSYSFVNGLLGKVSARICGSR